MIWVVAAIAAVGLFLLALGALILSLVGIPVNIGFPGVP